MKFDKDTYIRNVTIKLLDLFEDAALSACDNSMSHHSTRSIQTNYSNDQLCDLRNELKKQIGSSLDYESVKQYVKLVLFDSKNGLKKAPSFETPCSPVETQDLINGIEIQEIGESEKCKNDNFDVNKNEKLFLEIFDVYDVDQKGKIKLNDIYFALIELNRQFPDIMPLPNYPDFYDYLKNNIAAKKDINFYEFITICNQFKYKES